MEFKVGDRVRNTANIDMFGNNLGTVVAYEDVSSSFISAREDVVYVRYENGEGSSYGVNAPNSITRLKLIKKGDKEMAILKVGDNVKDVEGENLSEGLVTRVEIKRNGVKVTVQYNNEDGDTITYGVGGEYDLKDVILIKKGDSKMEETKEIKGLKVKIGSKIFDKNCSNIGIVIAGTPEHCIYKDLNDNKEHVSSWDNIKLEIQQPVKLLLPKEEKKKKVAKKKK